MYVLTKSGVKFDLLNPSPTMVELDDIAHALSRQIRFNGHVSANANVALHSVIVAYEVDQAFRLPALLHDAAEAYIGDIVRPFKDLMGHHIIEIENAMEIAIGERFGVDMNKGVHWINRADRNHCIWELKEFFNYGPGGVTPPLWLRKFYNLDAEASKKLFIETFDRWWYE